MQLWKPEEIKSLRDIAEDLSGPSGDEEVSAYEVCKAYNRLFPRMKRSYDSIQKKLLEIVEQKTEFTEPESSVAAFAIPGLVQEKVPQDRESVEDWLAQLLTVGKTLPKSRVGSKFIAGETSLVLVLSDTHFGKMTGGFSLEEAARRVAMIPHCLADKHAKQDISEIVVLLVGDMVEGEGIYPQQATHLEAPAIDQMKYCVDALWKLLIELNATFDVPVRVETCPGNHGETSRTANERTNWDNVVYYALHLLAQMHKDPNVYVNLNMNEFKTFEVQEATGLIYHRGVKHTGTPAMREKIAGWVYNKDLDIIVHGHWHEWHVGNWLGKFVLGNGCMCGPDDLSERIAKEESAKQAYFFVTGKKIWGFSYMEW